MEPGYSRSWGGPTRGPGSDPEGVGHSTRHILPTGTHPLLDTKTDKNKKHTLKTFLVGNPGSKQVNCPKLNWKENSPIHFPTLNWIDCLAI